MPTVSHPREPSKLATIHIFPALARAPEPPRASRRSDAILSEATRYGESLRVRWLSNEPLTRREFVRADRLIQRAYRALCTEYAASGLTAADRHWFMGACTGLGMTDSFVSDWLRDSEPGKVVDLGRARRARRKGAGR